MSASEESMDLAAALEAVEPMIEQAQELLIGFMEIEATVESAYAKAYPRG